MLTQEWPAEDYAIGSYIQASISEQYLNELNIKPTDHVLDIGCGNGSFSCKIIDKIPQGTFLGLDSSENMLQLAKKELAKYPNAKMQCANVLTMKFKQQFDYIVSFWCLQWCALHLEHAFKNIFQSLKPGGKIFAILASANDSFIASFNSVQAKGEFACLKTFIPPVQYHYFDKFQERLQAIPFKQVTVKEIKHELLLPSLDIFRKFVNGIVFFHGQLPADQINVINEAVVTAYANQCHEKHQGKYLFTASLFLVQAEK